MGNLVTGDGSNARRPHGCDGGRLAIEGRKLDLESLSVGTHVNNRPDVTDLQALLWHRRGQNDPIMLSNHREGSLPAWISRHVTKSLGGTVDNPDRSDQPPLLALYSLPRQPAVDNMFLAVHRPFDFRDFTVSGDIP